MDLETMMASSYDTGFPQFMTQVLEHMDFEDLLKTRLVSNTFYGFLMEKNQRKIWIQAASKVFSMFCQIAYNAKKFPLVRRWRREGWFTEELKNKFQQEWIEVLEKIKQTATVQQIIKICHILRETENPGKFCEAQELPLRSFSMIFEMSKMFIGQDDNLSKQIRKLHVTPSMHACYQSISEKKKTFQSINGRFLPITLNLRK